MKLADRIRVKQAPETIEDEVDYFSAALDTLFTDDTRNQHGDPGAVVIYQSDTLGELKLAVPDPGENEHRQLFAHYLWNASILAAIQIEDGAWSVKGKRVLELGAGLGLTGIVSSLCGAAQVVLSDYPASRVIENLMANLEANAPEAALAGRAKVQEHIWGEVDDEFSRQRHGHFDCVFAADCLWMDWQHENLAVSIAHFLAPGASSRAFIVAGFHSGRAKVAKFFPKAQEIGLSIERVYEEDVEGTNREWQEIRDGGRENVTERKRWLVVAVFKRA